MVRSVAGEEHDRIIEYELGPLPDAVGPHEPNVLSGFPDDLPF